MVDGLYYPLVSCSSQQAIPRPVGERAVLSDVGISFSVWSWYFVQATGRIDRYLRLVKEYTVRCCVNLEVSSRLTLECRPTPPIAETGAIIPSTCPLEITRRIDNIQPLAG